MHMWIRPDSVGVVAVDCISALYQYVALVLFVTTEVSVGGFESRLN